MIEKIQISPNMFYLFQVLHILPNLFYIVFSNHGLSILQRVCVTNDMIEQSQTDMNIPASPALS